MTTEITEKMKALAAGFVLGMAIVGLALLLLITFTSIETVKIKVPVPSPEVFAPAPTVQEYEEYNSEMYDDCIDVAYSFSQSSWRHFIIDEAGFGDDLGFVADMSSEDFYAMGKVACFVIATGDFRGKMLETME